MYELPSFAQLLIGNKIENNRPASNYRTLQVFFNSKTIELQTRQNCNHFAKDGNASRFPEACSSSDS